MDYLFVWCRWGKRQPLRWGKRSVDNAPIVREEEEEEEEAAEQTPLTRLARAAPLR